MLQRGKVPLWVRKRSTMNGLNNNARFGAIAVGRNEGERLKRCIASLSTASVVVYVDSGSTDGSAQWARKHGVEVVDLDMRLPFTAARARNAGFRRLREIDPDLTYVQFLDGDCELVNGWTEYAIAFLIERPDVAVVCGRLRERHPERSVYNWLCDREWQVEPGEVQLCGGIAMVRVDAFEAVSGFREDLIAGEEPELCVRLRRIGWRIWRLDTEMALHDAAMMRFGQWWRRALRSGYAFAEGAYLHGSLPERHWVWESGRAWLWGIILPVACLMVGVILGPWGWVAWLIYPLQVLRQAVRNQGSPSQRTLVALFQVLARFPEACGQIKFIGDRLFGRQAQLIEYK